MVTSILAGLRIAVLFFCTLECLFVDGMVDDVIDAVIPRDRSGLTFLLIAVLILDISVVCVEVCVVIVPGSVIVIEFVV